MPSWRARSVVAAAVRADSTPVSSPAWRAHTSAVPSRIEKRFDSRPSASSRMRPSVSTPSTSNSSSRSRRARAAISGGNAPAPAAGTVGSQRRQNISVRQRSCRCSTPATRPSSIDDQRRDPALLEDLQRFDGEHQRPDGDRAAWS